MTTLETKNGTKFNFKLDNGLPYKPTIETDIKMFSQKDNMQAGVVHLILNDLFPDNNQLKIESLFVDEADIYIDIGDYYIYAEHGNDFIYESAKNKTLIIQLFKNDKFIVTLGF